LGDEIFLARVHSNFHFSVIAFVVDDYVVSYIRSSRACWDKKGNAASMN
jgi:hypothetical protein|tara:strand:- start:3558 stop:3704 length:147 start_codon:yes stop_codon:yes gene_type:complete